MKYMNRVPPRQSDTITSRHPVSNIVSNIVSRSSSRPYLISTSMQRSLQ